MQDYHLGRLVLSFVEEASRHPISIVAALALYMVGHMMRVKNARALASCVAPTPRSAVIRSLSIGYLFSLIFPFKLGELARVAVLGDELRVSRGILLLAVLLERLIDCIVLSTAGLLLIWSGVGLNGQIELGMKLSTLPMLLLAVGAGLFVLLFAIYQQNQPLLRLGYRFSSIFNTTIRDRMRFKVWSAIHGIHALVRDADLVRYFRRAAGMWACYLAGTFVLTIPYAQGSLNRLLISALAQISSSMQVRAELTASFGDSFASLVQGSAAAAPLVALPSLILSLQLLPLAFVGLYFLARRVFSGKFQVASESAADPRLNKLQRKTDVSGEFSGFLDQYFLGTELFKHVNRGELKKDFHLLRTFKGGSNAVTMLVADRDGTPFVRKVTLNKYASKVKAQYEWLKHYGSHAPIPEVLNEVPGPKFYSYDVRFYPEAKTFFDYIHSNPAESSLKILDDVVRFLIESVYVPRTLVHSPENVEQYIADKVVNKVLDAAKASPVLQRLVEKPTLTVNGVRYLNVLEVVKRIRSSPEAMEDLANYEESPVHGDLTVDNLLVNGSQFVLLDPNNENFLSCMAVDFAKLFQSLHSGYEFLCKLESVGVKGTSISFEENLSNKYHFLFRGLDAKLREQLPPRVYRSLLFHEAVHYCRMLTYRVNIDPETVAAFYGIAVRLFNEFIEQYESRKGAFEEEAVHAIAADLDADGRVGTKVQ